MNITKLLSLFAFAGVMATVVGPADAAPICDKKINTTCSNFHNPVQCPLGSAVGIHSCYRKSNNIDYEVRARTTGTARYAATVLLEPTGVQAGNCVTKAEGLNQTSTIQCRARYTNSVAAMQMYAY